MICLLPNCCFLSETSRMIEIHRALTARGVVPRVATHGGRHERLLGEAGIPYDLLGTGFSDERCRTFVRSIPGIGAPTQSMWSDEEIRTYVAAEAAYFRVHGVQVAVTGWTLTALLSTRVVGIPLVTEHAGSFLPPVFERGMLPAPSGPVGMPLERWLPERLRRWLFNAGASRQTVYTDGFNKVAHELGIPGIPSFPALLLGDLTLVTDVPEVLGISREEIDSWTPPDPSRYRAGTRLRYTGPLYARFNLPIPERVERFLKGPRPVVYVAITSSVPELVRGVVAALRELDLRTLVAATVHDLQDLESDQVLVESILPSHAIMPRADLVVTAGGQGSVQTALASGVPLVGIPLQPEQDTNVALAVRAGVARLVPQSGAGGAVLRETVREMLADERYRQNARHLRAVFARTDGAGAAAEAILELLRDAPDEFGRQAHVR
jgi:UDP:flavonoid glycosyltransferase YjiC (YdhE family)